MSLIDKDYKPENWSDDNVVSSLSSNVRLPENSLNDSRPTLDDYINYQKKRESFPGNNFG